MNNHILIKCIYWNFCYIIYIHYFIYPLSPYCEACMMYDLWSYPFNRFKKKKNRLGEIRQIYQCYKTSKWSNRQVVFIDANAIDFYSGKQTSKYINNHSSNKGENIAALTSLTKTICWKTNGACYIQRNDENSFPKNNIRIKFYFDNQRYTKYLN